MCKECTDAGGSRVLWTSELGVRILGGLIVLTVEVITKLVLCSGRNFNNGEDSNICECVQMDQTG
jgi:hypothetical protein